MEYRPADSDAFALTQVHSPAMQQQKRQAFNNRECCNTLHTLTANSASTSAVCSSGSWQYQHERSTSALAQRPNTYEMIGELDIAHQKWSHRMKFDGNHPKLIFADFEYSDLLFDRFSRGQ